KLKSILIIIIFIIFCLEVCDYRKSKALEKYCLEKAVGSTIEEINSAVKSKKFYVHTKIVKESKSGTIDNHASPFFRMSCFIKIENGVVKSSKYDAGD
ncbi:hypothetical protein JXR93_00980, partial [bacterium]|nr:hypothetical protein [bacterium]